MGLEILATLWSDFPHYTYFAKDSRLSGIRLNTAMATVEEMPSMMDKAMSLRNGKDLYLDIKGKQLRIDEVYPNNRRLELRLNHPISLPSPDGTDVLFKAGADYAELAAIEDDGYRLVFHGGPEYNVIPGESIQVRSSELKVLGDTFTPKQIEFMKIGKQYGIDQWMLSYVGSQAEIDEFRKHIGDVEVIAKIEDNKGLMYVQNEFVKTTKDGLLTARGDLYTEVDRPHYILQASRDILAADPDAICGSRILLSMSESEVPECADLSECAWLMDIGYRRYMFCDELCLKKDSLDRCIDVLEAVYEDYGRKHMPPKKMYNAAIKQPTAKIPKPSNDGGWFSWIST